MHILLKEQGQVVSHPEVSVVYKEVASVSRVSVGCRRCWWEALSS